MDEHWDAFSIWHSVFDILARWSTGLSQGLHIRFPQDHSVMELNTIAPLLLSYVPFCFLSKKLLQSLPNTPHPWRLWRYWRFLDLCNPLACRPTIGGFWYQSRLHIAARLRQRAQRCRSYVPAYLGITRHLHRALSYNSRSI